MREKRYTAGAFAGLVWNKRTRYIKKWRELQGKPINMPGKCLTLHQISHKIGITATDTHWVLSWASSFTSHFSKMSSTLIIPPTLLKQISFKHKLNNQSMLPPGAPALKLFINVTMTARHTVTEQSITKQDRQCTHSVTLRRIHETVAVEKK